MTDEKNSLMREIKVAKVTLNVGTGKDQKQLERGAALIKHIVGIDPIKTITNKRIAGWGLRPGLPIGCKLTLRGKKAQDTLKRMIEAKENIIPRSCFDDNGNISFGIAEYIDIPDIDYNPEIGIMGFQVSVTLQRPGYRIKHRRLQKRKIPKSHKISKEEAISFMRQAFSIRQDEEQQ